MELQLSDELGVKISKAGYHFIRKNIEVSNNEFGKPDLRVMEPYNKLFTNLRVHISLSHSDKNSTAIVIIES